MKKLYEAYKEYPILSTVVTELSWSHNLLILFKTRSMEEKEFYLTSLDEKVKFKGENPSVGLILCKSKNEEIVRMTVGKAVSPIKVAAYKTKIIDKKLLENKLHSLPFPEKR